MKVKIRWTLEFDYPFLNDSTDLDFYKFILEENYCQENLLTYLASESEDNVCKMCSLGKVEFLGLVEDGE